MWPFSRPAGLSHRPIDDTFSVTSQISPDDVEDIKSAGFRSIMCARPDDEESGQPGFAEIAAAAERVGLFAVHIPISGQLTESSLIRMQQALSTLPMPMLGYCRSGARAGSIYTAARRAGR